MKRSFHFICLLAGALTCASAAATARTEAKAETYAGRPQVDAFVAEMAQRGLDPAWVKETLQQARKLSAIQQTVRPLPPGQRKNWRGYRERFIEPKRIEAGRLFMQQHAETLSRASDQFGVPVEVIVGILGVETFYGRDTGRFRVIDALATLAFDFPAEGRNRSDFFREQLAHFFIWCAKEQCQPLEVRGSSAGAFGLPQFMPGNIDLYGADFDGNGRIDLNHPADAIGSVARFLAKHGWVRQLEPVFPVGVEKARLGPLLAPDILPSFTPENLAELGAQPLLPLPQREAYALVELQNGESPSDYVLGSRNFFVLTRYNRSSYYAMAVLQLGRAVVAMDAAATAAQPDGKTNAPGGCAQC
jgi:membrane-bound lytic murein transglycosylase B